MFGLYMLLLVVIVKVVKDLSEAKEFRDRKKRSINKGQSFYLDENGSMVDVKTDIPYDYQRINGDNWKVHAYSRKPIENLSEKARNETEAKERAKAIAEGKSVYPFEGYKRHDRDEIVGVRFKDLKTGEIYVKREWFNGVWLLNINTCMFDRADDNYLTHTFSIPIDTYVVGGMKMFKREQMDAEHALEYVNKEHIERCKFDNSPTIKWHNTEKVNG